MLNLAKKVLFRMAVTGSVILGAASQVAYADYQVLASFDYGHVRANTRYTTGLTRVYNAPQFVGHVEVAVYGEYCNLVSYSLTFIQENNGPLYAAQPDGRGGFIVNSRVLGIDYSFEQTDWTDVDCRLEIRSLGTHNGGTPNGDAIYSDALSLSTNANLVSIHVKLAEGYESLRDEAKSLTDYVRYFLDAAKARQSHARLTSLFRLVQQQAYNFEVAYIPVHSRLQNRDVDDSWQFFVAKLDEMSAEFK